MISNLAKHYKFIRQIMYLLAVLLLILAKPAIAIDVPVVTRTWTVTPSAGAGGTISPSTGQVVNNGTTTTFLVTPNTGYSVSVNGTCGGYLSGTTYTTNAITANCTVSATFSANPAPVNGACGTASGGTFSTAPTTNLCSLGYPSPSSLSGAGPWSWSCIGSNGGTSVYSCSANVTPTASIPSCSITPTTASVVSGTGQTFTANCTNSPISYTWQVDGVQVAAGALNVYGTGTGLGVGSHTVTVTASNAGGSSVAASASLTINSPTANAAPVITSAGTASGTMNAAFSYPITASNSPTSYGASGLPTGLNINMSSGLISGTPSVSGTFYATVTATNAAGTGSLPVTITIATGTSAPALYPSLSAPVSVAVDGVSQPRIKKWGNNVYLLNGGANRNLMFYKSTDGGATFASTVLAIPVMNSYEYEFCMDTNGYLYALWENANDDQLYIRKSMDSGATWSVAASVASGFTWADQPVCHFSNGTLYVLFRAFKNLKIELFLTKSTDNGATFSTPVQVTSNTTQEDNGKIAVYGNNVYVIYYHAYSATPYNIYLVSSPNGGASFGSPIQINQTNGKSDFGPALAVDGLGNLFVAYSDTTTDGAGDLYVAKTTNGGASFTYTLAADSTYSGQAYPRAFVDSNNYLHLLWNDNRNTPSLGSVYYTRSVDGGASYSANVNLDNLGGIGVGSLFVDSDVVYLAVADTKTTPTSTVFKKISWLPVIAAPAIISLTATPSSVQYGATASIVWASSDTSSCVLFNTTNTSGSIVGATTVANDTSSLGWTTSALNANATYTLWCTNSAGDSTQQIVTVNVASVPVTIFISATPVTITSGGTSIIGWTSTNSTSCSITGAGAPAGALATSGSFSPQGLVATTTYTVTCAGAGGVAASQSVTVTVGAATPVVGVQLSKTGQTLCHDQAGAAIACAGTGHDGAIQAGAAWPNPRLTDNGDSTVSDNLTGLVWTKNANLPVGTNTWQQALDYVAGMNAGTYPNFGHTDWRLPNINELKSIIDSGQNAPALPVGAPFTTVSNNWYWSSTTMTVAPTVALIANMGNGQIGEYTKTASGSTYYTGTVGYVWPVRSGAGGTIQIPKTGQTTSYAAGDDGALQLGVAWPGSRFTDNGNSTVTDTLTGIMWAKDANLPRASKTWQQALDYVAGMNAGAYPNLGYMDWRLPNRVELESLLNMQSHPFVNLQNATFNSATTVSGDPAIAWVIDPVNGGTITSTKMGLSNVWPVRGGSGVGAASNTTLVGRWALDGNGLDSSSYGNNGTVSGAVPAADRFGNPNGAMSFNGTSDFISVPDSVSLKPAQLAISAWIKPSALSANMDVVSKYYGSGYYLRILNSNSSIDFSAGGTSNATSAVAPLGAWSHIVATYDGTYQKIYINGVLKHFVSGMGTGIVNVANPLAIGAFTSGTLNFSGAIDDVRIYNRALSLAEIQTLTNEGGWVSPFAVIPDAPTSVTATGSNAQATVSFTAPANTGGSAITGYIVTSNPGGVTATGAASPITVTGLTNGTAYTFTVNAVNMDGVGAASAASNPVTPIKVLTELLISGPAALVANGSGTYTAIAVFNDASWIGVTPAWSFTGTAASFANGILTAGNVTANGTVSISASYSEGGITKTASLPVAIQAVASPPAHPPQLIGLAITGAAIINEGATGSYSLVASYDDGTTAPVAGALSLAATAHATLTGATLNAALVTADQVVTLNASYTEGGITRTATLPVTVKDVTGTTLNLAAGWNLLGNGTDAPLDVTAALGDTTKVTTAWKWIPATSKWAFYAPSLTAPNLAAYAASKNYDVLSTINGGEGFWVNAKTAFTAQLPAGIAIGTAYFQDQLDPVQNKLLKGWNLIATGDNMSPSVFNMGLSVTPPAVGAIPINVTTLWAWDNALMSWYFYAPSLEANGGLVNYITGKNYLDFTARGKTLGQGVGFWVNKP